MKNEDPKIERLLIRLGNSLRHVRKHNRMTQAIASKNAKISLTVYKAMEQGKNVEIVNFMKAMNFYGLETELLNAIKIKDDSDPKGPH